jgi:dTDP-4-dehydrorhamnose 3,5-epimerase
MRVSPTALPGILIVEPKVIVDERGFFTESWSEQVVDRAVGANLRFV